MQRFLAYWFLFNAGIVLVSCIVWLGLWLVNGAQITAFPWRFLLVCLSLCNLIYLNGFANELIYARLWKKPFHVHHHSGTIMRSAAVMLVFILWVAVVLFIINIMA